MNDIAKVREMSDKELDDALKQAKQELWSARFALSTRQLNDTSSIPQTRHEIARILTVQRERGLGLVRVSQPRAAAAPARKATKGAAKSRSAKGDAAKGGTAKGGTAKRAAAKKTGTAASTGKGANE